MNPPLSLLHNLPHLLTNVLSCFIRQQNFGDSQLEEGLQPQVSSENPYHKTHAQGRNVFWQKGPSPGRSKTNTLFHEGPQGWGTARKGRRKGIERGLELQRCLCVLIQTIAFSFFPSICWLFSPLGLASRGEKCGSMMKCPWSL